MKIRRADRLTRTPQSQELPTRHQAGRTRFSWLHRISWLVLVSLLVWVNSNQTLAQTTATYIGPNNGNWSNPANWDIGVVPINNGGNTYNVIVPASKTVNFDLLFPVSISAVSIQHTGRIDMTNSQALNVSGLSLLSGTLNVRGAGSVFESNSPLAGLSVEPRIFASNGGVVRIAAPVYEYSGSALDGTTLLTASGSGSLIDLSNVIEFTDISGTGIFGGSVKTIEASNSGTIDLSSVVEIRSGTGWRYGNILQFNVNTGGNILLDNLEAINATGAPGLTLFNIEVPEYELPNLIETNQAHIKLGANSVLNAHSLTSFRNSTLTLDQAGSEFNASSMVDVSGSLIMVDGSAVLNTSKFAVIQNSRFHTTGGGVIETSSNTYEFTGGALDQFNALTSHGESSLIDMRSVTSLIDNTGTGIFGGSVRVFSAKNHGVIDLSNVRSITSGSGFYENRLHFEISDGGNIKLNNLENINASGPNGHTRFVVDIASYSLDNLTTAENTTFDITAPFGTLSLAELTAFRNGRLDVPALATLNAPLLSDISGSYFRRSGANIVNTAPITQADNAQLHTRNGASIEIAASNYMNTISYGAAFISAVNTNSRVSMNNLEKFSVIGAGVNTVEASSNGTVNLRGVESINSGGGLRFLANSGGKINIGGDSDYTQLTGGTTQFVTTGTNSVIRFGSSMEMAENTVMQATLNGRFEAEGSLFLKATNPNNFDLKDGALRMIGTELQGLEVMSHNRGIPTGTLDNEFQIGLLQVGTNTIRSQVILQDQFVNGGDGTGSEALYLQGFPATNGLRIMNSSSLILNGHDVFISDGQGNFVSARNLVGPGQRYRAYDGGYISLTGEVGEVLNGDFQAGPKPGDFNVLPATIGFDTTTPVNSGRIVTVSRPRPGNEDNKAVQMYAGSMVELSQHVSTLFDPFYISFDAWAQDDTGTLSLLLDGQLLQSWSYSELGIDDFLTFSVKVDDPTLIGQIDLKLAFQWDATTNHSVILDDIRMTAVPEPSTLFVLLIGTAGVACRRRSRQPVTIGLVS